MLFLGFSRSLGLSGILPPILSAWSANLIEEATPGAPGIQLNYSKGCTVIPDYCSWNPWDDTYTDAEFNSGPSWGWMKPQPILSDIEVDDDGSLLLAFADRTGHQFAYRNRRPQSTNQAAQAEGVIGGDILRIGAEANADLAALHSVDGRFEEGDLAGLAPAVSVAARTSAGGGSYASVASQIVRIRALSG